MPSDLISKTLDSFKALKLIDSVEDLEKLRIMAALRPDKLHPSKEIGQELEEENEMQPRLLQENQLQNV